MAELIKQQHKLAVLHLFMNWSDRSTGGRVVFAVEISRSEVARFEVPVEALGLPTNLRDARQYQYTDANFVMPQEVIDELRQILESLIVEETPLWIQLGNPLGTLPLVPWERLLQPQLGVALVRLPYFALQPVTPEDSLDVVLLVSAPQDKRRTPIDEQIGILTRQILGASDRYTVVHLFTNQRLYRTLEARLGGLLATATSSGVRLYDPQAAAAEKGADGYGYARSQNSWLRWVRKALAGRSVDVAHFVGSGYLSMNQGALDLAETPLNEDAQGAAGFLEAQELVHFLTHIGAWAAGFSAAPHNLSSMGLRLLADQVARLRPGPVFLHEVADDHDGSAAHATYHFLFGHGERPLPRSSAVGLYCHPKYVEAIRAEEESPVDAKLRQFSFAEPPTVKAIEAPTNTPTWIASSQRYIEQTAAKVAEQEPNSVYQNATQAGIEEALRFVSDVIARHAQEPMSSTEPEAGA